jgi:hypothetical protein
MSPRTFAAAALAVPSLLAAAGPASARLMVLETQGFGGGDGYSSLLDCQPLGDNGCYDSFRGDGTYLRFIYDTADIIPSSNPVSPHGQSVTVLSAEMGWRGTGEFEGLHAKGAIPVPVTLRTFGHGVTGYGFGEYDPTGAYDHGLYDRTYELTVSAGAVQPFSFYNTYDQPSGGLNYLWIRAADDQPLGYGEVEGIFYLYDSHLDVHALAAPEPAAWALMLAGFGLAGAALRRRRAAGVAG